MATEFDIRHVEDVIQHHFVDTTLLRLALTAPQTNSLEEGGMPSERGNQRLMILGDAVLRLVMTDNWYLTQDTKAQLADTYVTQSSNHALSTIAFQTGISNCIKMSGCQAGASVPPATSCGAIKAIMGVAWLDSGKDCEILKKIASQLKITNDLELPGNGFTL